MRKNKFSDTKTDKANREKDDFTPTPEVATEALLSVEEFEGAIWESACGDGAICKVLQNHGYATISTDLVDRGYGEARVDFLMEWKPRAPNIITNPPFKLAAEFMWQCDKLASKKTALFLPLRYLAGIERAGIYKNTHLARIWVFSGRLTMWRNGEKKTENGGMIDFAWLVWDKSVPIGTPPKLGFL